MNTNVTINDDVICSMKTISIFFDCHGREILKNFELNNIFAKKYSIHFIDLNNYVIKGGPFYNNINLDEKDINVLENTDILILQVIEKDRAFLNNNAVIKYLKKNCIIIKIPHYRNSIYEYKTLDGFINKCDLINRSGIINKEWSLPNKIKDLDNVDDTIKIIQTEIDIMNNFPYDRNEMLNCMNLKINEFEKLDNLSDIKMLDYYNNNYKKYRLFMGRSYPSSRFFFELANRILIKIGFDPNETFKDHYFAENTSEPIPDYWYNFCNFSFDKTYYIFGHIKITECEWYYILLLSKNINICSIGENINYLKKIRRVALGSGINNDLHP